MSSKPSFPTYARPIRGGHLPLSIRGKRPRINLHRLSRNMCDAIGPREELSMADSLSLLDRDDDSVGGFFH